MFNIVIIFTDLYTAIGGRGGIFIKYLVFSLVKVNWSENTEKHTKNTGWTL